MPTVTKSPAHYLFLAVLLTMVSCFRGGATDSTPTAPPPVLTTVSVALGAATVQLGQGTQANASGLDQNNASIATGSVTWSSSLPAVATVTASGSIAAVGIGQTQIIAVAGGRTGQATLTVIPVPVASVSVTPASSSLAKGTTAQLTATPKDANGTALAGRTVTWVSSSSAVASVSTTGFVTAVAVGGPVTITATVEGINGTSSVTVTPVPVASVTVSPATATVGVGSTQQLAATVKDTAGNIITDQAVAWSTSDATKATVSQTGLVTAVALGAATITASSGGKTGTASITVAVASVATVAVTPATGSLVVGGTLTVTATALDANGNVLAGQSWSWISTNANIVSGTSVTNVLTATGAGVGTATVTATAGGKSASSVITVVASAPSVTLSAPGQSTAFLDSPAFAAALTVQAGSQYLIAVVNTDPSYAINEDFTLSGTFGAVSASQVLAGPVRATVPVAARTTAKPGTGVTLPSGLMEQLALRRRAARHHLAILEQTRETFMRLGSPSAAWARVRAQAGRTAPISASVSATIGVVNAVYVANANGGCTAPTVIGARTVAVGQHVIVLADTNRTAWPQAFRPDSSWYQAFASEYDQVTWPTLLTYIGNPLAYDASLSGTGKVTVTITPVVNNSGAFAYVASCDFYPLVPSGQNLLLSNQTEMIYAQVPSANGLPVSYWESYLRSVAAHESKHVVSFSDRILLGSRGVDEVWLEEGLAQVSQEIWERHFNQATWKGGATFAQTVACEYNLAAFGFSCDGSNSLPLALMGGQLPYLFDYLQAESSTNAEGLGADVPADYGAGWAFSRWIIDQYAPAGAEGTFIQSLINTTLTGLTNLSSHTGQPIPLLLTYWNVASAIFQTPAYAAADVRTTIPSFNFANIFQVGQNGFTQNAPFGFFTSSGSPVYPVTPTGFSTGAFSRTVHALPGTSASFFLLSGTTAGIETLQLFSGSGGALSGSSGFRVAILRVQ